ncbi:hypothetical protein PR048_009164 [Dryococelus australis]|uniref:Uncharacterized protein n=1 Tax=Dryococelus australis TaxID=614101 RepID=A0ABQ9HZ39_9NEOP|nr:hypothetical protein PR048_009164 [Dryococelus australis]
MEMSLWGMEEGRVWPITAQDCDRKNEILGLALVAEGCACLFALRGRIRFVTARFGDKEEQAFLIHLRGGLQVKQFFKWILPKIAVLFIKIRCKVNVGKHTACIWYEKKISSYVVLSDDLTHPKESAWLFLKAVVSDFQKVHFDALLTHLYVFSDNCAAQFKSKFTVCNLRLLADELNVEYVEWNTFAPGHGKRAVDAFGGLLKRTVWTAVKSKAVTVTTSEDFYNRARELSPTVDVLYVPKSDVDSTSSFLNERWKDVK